MPEFLRKTSNGKGRTWAAFRRFVFEFMVTARQGRLPPKSGVEANEGNGDKSSRRYR
jgi:hypothetical protein